MSTNKAVRDEWKDLVFDKFPAINSYPYEIDPDSGKDLSKGMSGHKVNFFMYVVQSSEVPLMTEKNDLVFTVRVTRLIEHDEKGDNYNTIADDFRTLLDYFYDNLGISWNNTVDMYTEVPDTIEIESVKWGSESCWRAVMEFKAVKEIDA